jgi:hypothetical protein
MANNQGWVNVDIDSDTARFATNSIRQWWVHMGRKRFRNATELLVTADGGGSLKREDFHGEWNYSIKPRSQKS